MYQHVSPALTLSLPGLQCSAPQAVLAPMRLHKDTKHLCPRDAPSPLENSAADGPQDRGLRKQAVKWASKLIARGSGLHIPPGVDGRVVHPYFVVHVRAGRTAADAGVPNHFPALHAGPRYARECGKVCVERGDA